MPGVLWGCSGGHKLILCTELDAELSTRARALLYGSVCTAEIAGCDSSERWEKVPQGEFVTNPTPKAISPCWNLAEHCVRIWD